MIPPNSTYHIRPFQPTDQAAARELVLAGLAEHFGILDESRNPDLDDIAAHYLAAGHEFVVAEENGRPIGTGALLIHDDDTAQIVRVSVAAEQRRRGIARAIVHNLVNLAQQRQISKIIVETNDDWPAAINLYQRYGFQPYKHEDGEIYFQLMSENRKKEV